MVLTMMHMMTTIIAMRMVSVVLVVVRKMTRIMLMMRVL